MANIFEKLTPKPRNLEKAKAKAKAERDAARTTSSTTTPRSAAGSGGATSPAPRRQTAGAKKKSKAQRPPKVVLLVASIILVAALVFLGIYLTTAKSSKGNSNNASSATVPALATAANAAQQYYKTSGKSYPSTFAMQKVIAKAVPGTPVIDANNFPKTATKTNGQMSVLVSGGPLLALGEYSTSVNNGIGGCVYAISFAFGPGNWGYGVGAPGEPCGTPVQKQPVLNTITWKHQMP